MVVSNPLRAGFQRPTPWAIILGIVFVGLVLLSPLIMTMDRAEIKETIIESKGTALSYLNSWSSGGKDGDDGNGMEIGDDTVDYDDYDDDVDGVEKARPPPSPRKMGVDADAVAEKYFMKSPPPPPSSSPEVKKGEKKEIGGKTFLQALAGCKDMACVREAHMLPREEDATYNFPHFLIIGFQKAATTSLHVHLGKHDDALRPANKEPEFFTNDCKNNPPDGCTKASSEKYIKETLRLDDFIESKGSKATYESSTHVVRRADKMAPALYKLIPWTKIIISLREPISRAASMLIHMKDVYNEGCLSEKDLGYCLHARSQIRGLHDGTNTYYDALTLWFKHWPAEQIHIVQYEELTNPETEDSTIREVKEFIGLDPNLPKAGLTVINDRRFRIQPDGWPMARKQYEKVINLVKSDVEATLDLMERHGKVKDRKKWMERWESVWAKNLETCDKNDKCTINLS